MNPSEIFGKQENSYVSFAELETAFKTPTQRQADYEPKPDPQPSTDPGDLGTLANPDGLAFVDPDPLEPEPEEVSPEKAQRTGMRIARLVDTGIDFALSNFVAHNGESYKADERDLEDIAECWGELAQEKGWSIGPEWSLIILYVMVYGPLVKQAVTDRRLAELEARQAALEEQMKTFQMGAPQPTPQPATPADHGNDNPAPGAKPSPFTYQPQA